MSKPATATAVEAKVKGISVSPDGRTIGVAVDWVDASTRQTRTRTCIAITDGQVLQFGRKLGDAPAVAASLTAEISSLAQSTVDELVSSKMLQY